MKKNKGNILITRPLCEYSPIMKLNSESRSVMAQSFLDISPVLVNAIPQAEVYFFYSKNAVKYFIQAAKELNIELNTFRYATMGHGTASALEAYEYPIDFIGQGSPSEIANKLIATYSNQSICFVRAEHSTQSIQKLWPSHYNEVIVYSVRQKTIQIKEEIHTLFATSPMNLEAALNCCDITNLKRKSVLEKQLMLQL